MIKENRASRYLIYAIGEILLVVIGILIALQINNYNEKRKLLNTQTTYLNQLYKDVSFMENGYRKRIISAKDRASTAHKGLAYVVACNPSNLDKQHLDELLLSHQTLSAFYSVHDTYDEMLSANVLANLSNQELKESIKDLYTSLDFSNSFIPYFRSDLGRAGQIIWRHVSFGYDAQKKPNVTYDLTNICDEIEFKNALVEVVDSREDYLGNLEELLKKMTRTKKDIATELNINYE